MKKTRLYLIALAILFAAGLVITYSNHFNNGFHFDDSHTIQDNPYITSLKNVPLFFKDTKTFSSMPSHQGYRPMVTTTLAVDYWLGGGLKPFYFHLSTFLWFVLLCILLFFVYKKISKTALKHTWAGYVALVAAAVFAFHTVNAETINYIISRSDVLSTLCIIASVAIFILFPHLRKWGIYILPAILCVGFKETALIIPVLLFFYVIFFEKNLSLTDLFKACNLKTLGKTVLMFVPILIIIGLLQYYSYAKMPREGIENIDNPVLPYVLTQTFVWVHYFLSFFLPINLSADTDWTVLSNPFDDRIMVGVIFVIVLVFVIFKTASKAEQRPIAFGLIWFTVSLLPTSLVPLTEVLNDHRMFLPFTGLTFSVIYTVGLLVVKNEHIFIKNRKNLVVLWVAVFLILSAFAYGTHQRNEVWKDEESLWLDVTIKSPKNGRGLMNYGLTQMAKANYPVAEKYFEQALEYTPYYSFLHINLGILKNAMGKPAEAEGYFNKAIQYGPQYNEPYYYYAGFLLKQNRIQEARRMEEQDLLINPIFMQGLYQMMDIYNRLELWEKLDSVALHTLSISGGDTIALKYREAAVKKVSAADQHLQFARQNPTPENYLNLSLQYYHLGQYEKCIEACNEALKLKPDYAEAYNNICSAYNAMHMWDKGAEACEKALKINPSYELAKNNLAWAKSNL
ncbi:MAG TPA: tetratricopeptide repeat protein [Bacteroidales bacterium]|nr:tetratricopeptide repeat protein [Bacteroidales bacterium]HNZ42878.1 tetratricopeptide repeat protein [Bacteroidales bacterium]HOH83024.1 tetratricopeptide repeat protein [Bacteroidales bacterium]HPB25276.1 tetratricopeptide repeat protein [Bacteroidales bacterium]HPI30370.1 tetratricopeptide repeat protein [Bacteroidales bacterium]